LTLFETPDELKALTTPGKKLILSSVNNSVT